MNDAFPARIFSDGIRAYPCWTRNVSGCEIGFHSGRTMRDVHTRRTVPGSSVLYAVAAARAPMPGSAHTHADPGTETSSTSDH